MTKIRCVIMEKLDRRGFLRASAIGVSAMSSVLTSCGGLRYVRSSMDGADIRIDRRDVDAPGVLVDGRTVSYRSICACLAPISSVHCPCAVCIGAVK